MKKFFAIVTLVVMVSPAIAFGADAPSNKKSDEVVVTTTFETIR